MSTITVIALAAICVLVGGAIGYLASRRREQNGAGSPEQQGRQLGEQAEKEADTIRRHAELEAKELLLKAKTEAEGRAEEQLRELTAQRDRQLAREESLGEREDELRERERQLARKEQELEQREQTAEATARTASEMHAKAQGRLEQVARMSTDQAREQLIEQMRDKAREDAATEIKRIEDETEQLARQRATTIIANAIQRYASEYVGERTVSVVQLPNDEMKGRIIGREGRNIRALEAATGVDLIIDDTPEAVILSCFNAVRREVARLALTRLIADGRIHPSRIEEVVKRCEGEVAAGCKEAGEQAVFDLGLNRVHPKLVALLGELKFRSSHAQNVLQHSVEVGYVAGVIASELGLPVKQARRAGLLHDVGKAAPHELEGSHAAVGAQLAKKYGENPKIVHAIAAHHGEVEQQTVLAHIVDAANRLSGQRPGARRDRLASFIQRLHDLEKLCEGYAGVERAFAIQAGREVRVIVHNDQVDDATALLLSKDIARQVEDELAYPGQIRVAVIREARASDVAR